MAPELERISASYVCVSVTQSCPTLCDPVDYSPPGSIHGILKARTLEWVAIPFSRESSRPRDQTQVSCIADSLLPEPPGTESIIWRVYKNTISWTPLPNFLTQWIWDGSRESEFLESLWMIFMILSEDYHTLSFFICAIIVFTHLDNFQSLFLQVFFSSLPFLLSCSGTSAAYIRPYEAVPQLSSLVLRSGFFFFFSVFVLSF